LLYVEGAYRSFLAINILMKFNLYILSICALMVTPSASYASTVETCLLDTAEVRTPHVLREVEIYGVKQLPDNELDAVTRISPAMVKRYNIMAMKDVSQIAPNFYIPDYGSRMTSSIYVRGLGARIDQPVVGLSVDNVPILNKDNYDFDLGDIEHIEIIRGAQSALNGRNTMGGQINISTLSPWNYQGLRFMLDYGKANTVKASAGWYGKIHPDLATSITGYYSRTDGYFRNGYDNRRLDTGWQTAGRWKLAWRPSQALSITNTAAATVSRQGGYPYASVESGEIAYNDSCFYRRTALSDGLTVAWAGKRVVVTSQTSVQYLNDNMTLDQDFTPADYFTLTQKRREKSVTQDLFTRGTRGCYTWLGGVFGFFRSINMNAPVNFKNTGISQLIEYYRNQANPYYPIEWDSRQFLLGSDFTTTDGGFAIYHESKLALGNWSLEAALRWDYESTAMKYHSYCDAGFTTWQLLDDGTKQYYRHDAVNIDDTGRMSQSFNELLPKLTIAYNTNNASYYISGAKGYKSGGFNSQMFSDVLQQRVRSFMGLSMTYNPDDVVSYRPEHSWNFELGAKTTWLNNRLTADAAVFFIDCRDQQLTMFPSGTTTGRIMANAGRTFSRGAELTASYEPTHAVRLRASYGYTHATFHKFDNGIADYSGKRLPYAPSNTFFAGADWHLPFSVSDAHPTLSVNVRGVGDIYWDEANTVRQPFYALLGAALTIDRRDWSAKLWAENLTSTKYDTFYFVSMSRAFVQRGKPVTFGITLRYNIPQ
jgi:outer membrane receptor protein involved in Fe transport